MRAAIAAVLLMACSGEQLEWATPEISQPFVRDVQATNGFSNDIYVKSDPPR